VAQFGWKETVCFFTSSGREELPRRKDGGVGNDRRNVRLSGEEGAQTSINEALFVFRSVCGRLKVLVLAAETIQAIRENPSKKGKMGAEFVEKRKKSWS